MDSIHVFLETTLFSLSVCPHRNSTGLRTSGVIFTKNRLILLFSTKTRVSTSFRIPVKLWPFEKFRGQNLYSHDTMEPPDPKCSDRSQNNGAVNSTFQSHHFNSAETCYSQNNPIALRCLPSACKWEQKWNLWAEFMTFKNKWQNVKTYRCLF